MTTAFTATAAMQLVEQGRVRLDQPADEILPELAAPKIFDGFDVTGALFIQMLPCYDARAVALYGPFERGLYRSLRPTCPLRKENGDAGSV